MVDIVIEGKELRINNRVIRLPYGDLMTEEGPTVTVGSNQRVMVHWTIRVTDQDVDELGQIRFKANPSRVPKHLQSRGF